MKKLVLPSLLFLSMSAHAINVQFLRNSVLTEFSKEESKAFRSWAGQQLETLPDQQVAVWKNDSGKLVGKLKPTVTYESSGNTCRRSLFIFSSKDKKEPFQFQICKVGDKWQIQDTPAKFFKKSDWTQLQESVQQTLDNKEIGIPFSWHNAKTKNSGSQVTVAENKKDGVNCRTLAISIFSKKGGTASGRYNFCQDNSGAWQRGQREIAKEQF